MAFQGSDDSLRVDSLIHCTAKQRQRERERESIAASFDSSLADSLTMVDETYATTALVDPGATYGEHSRGSSDPTSANVDQKQVLIPIADGSCETETITLSTTLQKFGAIVVLASVGGKGSKSCSMDGGFTMTADITIEEAMEYDWDLIVLPDGGKALCDYT